VRKIVHESQKLKYSGLIWSGGRANNRLLYDLAKCIEVEPSTMQTKVRGMIRNGFLHDNNTCPLVWTVLGGLWNDLYSIGNHDHAKTVYTLTLATSLLLFAFDNNGYNINPAISFLPLKLIFSLLDKNNTISYNQLRYLIDGNTGRKGENVGYWISDLINSGLFFQEGDTIKYTNYFDKIIREYINFIPNASYSDIDWYEIHNNQLIDKSPFSKIIKETLLDIIGSEIEDFKYNIQTVPVIEAVSIEIEKEVPDIEILSDNVNTILVNKRVRNSVWSIRVKKEYGYNCIVPYCDSQGYPFIVAAHVKPDSSPESAIPHRAHLLNGICLCHNCHAAFDKGLFSIDEKYKIVVSPKLENIEKQHTKRIISQSINKIIKDRLGGKMPLQEFIRFHRENIFQK